MDFFAEQDRARRNTRRLLVLLALAVLVLIVLTNLVVAFGLWALDDRLYGGWDYAVQAPALEGARPPGSFFAYLSLPLFLAVGAGVSTAVALASGLRHLQLARGGAAVAEMLGGSVLDPASQDPAERRLLNVVEEMSIASGLPVPRVYRVPGEGINAFAAGYAPGDAVIGVTDAALGTLGRDELQGVMAHEFSHILNGDMRLNLRLVAVLYGILFIAQAGRVLLESGGRASARDRKGGSLAMIGLGLLVLGSAGVFFGRLIKAGVSREREFLADASAVQFTRNPLGLADALRRIGALAGHGQVANPRAEEASHMFFAQAVAMRIGSLFATHPPLEERIRRIDPGWDGRFVPRGVAQTAPAGAAPGPQVGSVHDAGGHPSASPTLDDPLHIDPLPIAGLSAELRATCRSFDGAAGAVLAALIDPRAPVAARQAGLLAQRGYAPPVALETELADASPVPVIELAMPALSLQDEAARERLWSTIQELIALDGHLDLREISAAVLLERQLSPRGSLARATRPRYRRLEQVAGALSVLCSALAAATPGDTGARFAAAAAAAELPSLRRADAQSPDWPALRAALAELRGVFPLLKPRVLKGCRAAIGQDAGAEPLLGLLAATLDCPSVIVNER
jgi:Zn-dependent protease with chaperone function